MNLNDIQLQKIGDPSSSRLPRGIHVVIFDNNIVFVKRVLGKFIQLSAFEQEELKRKLYAGR